MRPAVFLDRDDTLIRCREITPDGDLGDPGLVELLPGVAEGCRALKDAGFALIVITNQGGVARGKYDLAAVDRVHARLNQLLDGVIDAFRACPHHPDGAVAQYTCEHPWRKPNPGMILDAAGALGLDLPRSWVIGDSVRDCRAGRAAGCRTILIRPDSPRDEAVDFTTDDFAGAVGVALGAPSIGVRSSEPPRRLLVIAPTWIGDVVMATPTLRALRDRLCGSFLGGLVKPGVEELLAGTDFFDALHVDSRAGVMGAKRAAGRVRSGRYDAVVVMTNSFSTALVARLAGIPRRIGYGRDGRSMLLTESLSAPRRANTPPFSSSSTRGGVWAPNPACGHYLRLAQQLLDDESIPLGPMELALTDAQRTEAEALLARAGLAGEARFVVLNPGGNNPAKRWPASRFAELARWIEDDLDCAVVVAGSPSERDLADSIVSSAGLARERSLPAMGLSLGSLKGVLRRAALLITNDTGPRHIAAAFGAPVVTLFGPTDPRWTTIPFDREIEIVADPALPLCESAEDHPERCRIDRIELGHVAGAVERAMSAWAPAGRARRPLGAEKS